MARTATMDAAECEALLGPRGKLKHAPSGAILVCIPRSRCVLARAAIAKAEGK